MKHTKIVVAALSVALTGLAFANPKGDEIMQKVHDVKKPQFNTSAVVMTLIGKNGAVEETRNVMEYGKSDDTKTVVVMDFKSPASIAGTRFLQEKIENSNQENKFIYLPALKSVRRVNASEGSKAFMGTDASYDDMSTREMNEDTHEFIREEAKQVGATNYPKCYVIEEKPVDPKSSQYSKKIVWVDDDTMYPVYTELYDKNGKLIKVLTVEKIQKFPGATGEEYRVPMKNGLENVQTGHKTLLEVKQIKIDSPIPDRVFTQQFLSTGK